MSTDASNSNDHPTEKTPERHIVVFYDANCIDGITSSWAFDRGMKDQEGVSINYVPIPNALPKTRRKIVLDNIEAGGEVVFLDTHPREETLAMLAGTSTVPDLGDVPKVKKLTIVDHHGSAEDMLKTFEQKAGDSSINPNGIEVDFHLDKHKNSAAEFAWEIYNKGTPQPELLKWVNKLEQASVGLKPGREECIASYIDSKDLFSCSEGEAFRKLEELKDISEDEMAEKGKPILEDQIKNLEKLKAQATFVKIQLLPETDPMYIPMFSSPIEMYGRRVNKALLDYAQEGSNLGVVGVWTMQRDASIKLSLRTNSTPDASLIAKHLEHTLGAKSGGHKDSAVAVFPSLDHFASKFKFVDRERMQEERFAHGTQKARELYKGEAPAPTATSGKPASQVERLQQRQDDHRRGGHDDPGAGDEIYLRH